jgi:hypothetical protein
VTPLEAVLWMLLACAALLAVDWAIWRPRRWTQEEIDEAERRGRRVECLLRDEDDERADNE